MPVPTNLDVDKALIFFHAYMYGPLQGKLRLYKDRDIAPHLAASSDWEVFASILVRDAGTRTQKGLDLQGYEVKSAKWGSGFEYQYHRKSWKQKMQEDRAAGHIFISHKQNLRYVEIRHVEGSLISEEFIDEWEENEPYTNAPNPNAPNPRQRYRKSIPFKWVIDHGILVLRLKKGEVDYP